MTANFTRRTLLARGLSASAATAATGSWLLRPQSALAQQIPPWPSGLPPALVGSSKLYLDKLPSGRQLYRDVERMVDFGPRFTGTPAHAAWIDWIEEELVRAGCQMLPRDNFGFDRWLAERWELEILGGSSPGPVPRTSGRPPSWRRQGTHRTSSASRPQSRAPSRPPRIGRRRHSPGFPAAPPGGSCWSTPSRRRRSPRTRSSRW